ncbi:F-box/WD repeat-containing protein 7, partial [Hondaea fermentalgiana]
MGRIQGVVRGVAQSADLVLAASDDLRAWSKTGSEDDVATIKRVIEEHLGSSFVDTLTKEILSHGFNTLEKVQAMDHREWRDLGLILYNQRLKIIQGFKSLPPPDGALVLEMKTPNDKKAASAAVQGNLAAVGTLGGGLFLIDLATASVLHALEGHTGGVLSVIFDGNEIVSGGGNDQTVRVWDKMSGRETLRIDAGARVWSVAAHENLLVAGLEDNTVRVFDRASGGPRHVLTEATGVVYAVAIDAQRMVSGSGDNKVRVYAVPSFQLVRVLEGHTSWVRSVALEGDRIVSGSYDNTVRLWDARSGDALHVLQGHSNWVKSVSLLGSEIVSGSVDWSVRIWDAETGASTRVLD